MWRDHSVCNAPADRRHDQYKCLCGGSDAVLCYHDFFATMTVATCSGMQAHRQRQLIAILAEYNEAACSDAPPVHVAMLLTGRRERAAHGDR